MNHELNEAFKQPDIDKILLHAAVHADSTMRKYIWRGFRPGWKSNSELTVGDQTAGDFVQEALKRLSEGKRTYDASKTLLQNLNSITDSLIWSEKKSSDRTGVVDYEQEFNEEGLPSDPISVAKSEALSPADASISAEVVNAQTECFRMIRASFDGDKEMQDYLDALSAGYSKRSEVAELMGVSVETVTEIRKKLTKYAPVFFGAKNFKEFHHKLIKGESK
jgi:DNA-directed RNA polymerase specialized sigma24 family protein